MMSSTPAWVPKLEPELKPKIVDHAKSGTRMLVPSPMLVAEQIRTVRRGTFFTTDALREKLALATGAETVCPMTSGICLSIVAGFED